MADPPADIADCEAFVAYASATATITVPAAWLRDVFAYLRAVEAEAQMQRADEPACGAS